MMPEITRAFWDNTETQAGREGDQSGFRDLIGTVVLGRQGDKSQEIN